MELIKKVVLTLLVVLFFISIFKDLTTGTVVQPSASNEPLNGSAPVENEEELETSDNNIRPIDEQSEPTTDNEHYEIVRKTTQPGDTVLSIVESLNADQHSLHMEQILQDFSEINPGVDPHKIQPNVDYLFPVYHN